MMVLDKGLVEKQRSHVAGFTLVELLVAMALVGMISVLLFSGMRFGTRVWDRSNAHLDGADEVRIAQQLLQHALGEAYPFFVTTDPTHPQIMFDGSASRIVLLAPPPASLGAGGLAQYEFSIASHDGKFQLVMAVRPELARAGNGSTTAPEVLLAGMKSISFSFFGATQRDGPSGWRDQWSGEMTLPKLIRIDGGFLDSDARIWPELVIATRIDMDVSCVFDPLTRYCRGRG
jgi:general secretion pathway protein J